MQTIRDQRSVDLHCDGQMAERLRQLAFEF